MDKGEEAVWRVCRVINGDCERCPSTETIKGTPGCQRLCYSHAVECINTVETGNPWRKTEGVGEPWSVLSAVPVQKGGRLSSQNKPCGDGASLAPSSPQTQHSDGGGG